MPLNPVSPIPLTPFVSRLLWEGGRPQPVAAPPLAPFGMASVPFSWGGVPLRPTAVPAVHRGSPAGSLMDPPNLACEPTEAAGDAMWLRPDIRGAVSPAVSVQIYVAGSKGCHDLLSRLGAPVFKIGTTTSSPHERMIQLGEKRYGSLVRRGNLWAEEKGFDRWDLTEPVLDIALSPASCVVPLPGALGIRLPKGLGAEAFDKALTSRLRSVAIDAWPHSETVRHHLIACGKDPDCAVRASPAGSAFAAYGQEVQELYFFRKKRDFTNLALVAEDIVLAALGAR